MARILIAEDNADLRDLVARALTDDSHDVTEAADGAAALDQLRNHNGAFDMLLSDVKMPIMDGIALSLATGRDYPTITIVLMTGYADQRERTYGLDALVRDVIAKPFSLEQLKGAIRGALLVHA